MVLYDSAVVGKMIAVGWLAMELEIRWALVLYDSAVVGKKIVMTAHMGKDDSGWLASYGIGDTLSLGFL